MPQIEDRQESHLQPDLTQDTRTVNFFAEDKPEEAAENIKVAQQIGLEPDGYKSMKREIEEMRDTSRSPQTSKAVGNVAGKSTQHASVVKPDLDVFEKVERYVKFGANVIQGKDISRDVFNLAYRKAMGDELNEEEEFELLSLNDQLRELNGKREEYEYDFKESIPAEVLGTGYDFAQSLWEGRDLSLLGGGTGLAVGGVLGSAAGPFGLIIGGGVGAVKGAAVGTLVGQARDVFRQSTGQVYNDLTHVIKDGSELAEAERRKLARGAGTLMAAVGFLPIQQATRRIPWLQKIVSPRKFVKYLLSAEGSATRRLVMDLGKSGMAEAIEEGSQETIQIITSSMGETWDGSETSLREGLNIAKANWQENAEQVGKAMVIGGIAGSTLTGGLRAAGAAVDSVRGEPRVVEGEVIERESRPPAPPPPPSDISGPNLPVVVRGSRAIQLKIVLDQYRLATKDTSTNINLPDEMSEIRQSQFEDAGMSHVYVDKEELNMWADNDEKAAKALEVIDSSGVAQTEINAPLRVEMNKFLKLLDDYPELSNFAKVVPEDPSANQWLARLEDAERQRQELESQLPQGEQTPPQETRTRDEDVFGEDDYLEQPTFTEEMYKVLPKGELIRFNEAQLTTRTEVADAIQADSDKRMDRVVDLHTQFQLMFEEEMERARVEDDSRIQMVEDYLDNARVLGELSPEQQAKVDKGIPLYQVNPESLPPRLKQQYEDNPTLKKRKVFAKDGMNINEVANLFGVKPRSFLANLANTPTKEQQVENNLAQREVEIEEEARSDSDFEDSQLAKAYNNMTRNHIKEMKYLLNKNWGAVKKGIKRIAFDLPKLPNLIRRAKDQVGGTFVKHLNPNQWKVGERRSQKKAVKAILDNRVEEAFREKENAAYNAQLAKETHIAIGKVNRAFNFITKIQTNRGRAVLNEAGKVYADAVDYFLALYNFDSSKRTQLDVDAYNRFVRKMVREGKGDFDIPPEVQEWLTTKRSARDLTVDQVLFISDKVRQIYHQAKLKNRLYNEYVADQENQTVELVEEAVVEKASSHPAYDPKRNERPIEVVGSRKKMANFFRNLETLIKNSKFINLELDDGVEGGFFQQLLHQPILGTGKHQGPYGYQAKSKLQGKLQKKFQKIAYKYYGRLGFSNLGVQRVQVREFRNDLNLNNGDLTKLDLIMMLANMGNAENKARMENYGYSRDDLMTILTRELEQKDFDFVQEGIWNTYLGLRDRIASVHKVTSGTDIDFVQPESFEAFGKTYEGGYFPLRYREDGETSSIMEMVKDELESADSSKIKPVKPYNALEGIVRSPHTKERTDSGKLVNLDINVLSTTLDEVLHDITMRVPIRDVMTLLNRKDIKESIISVVGKEKYNTLVNLVAQQTNSASVTSMKLFNNHQNFLTQTFSQVESAFAVNYILFNVSSVVMSTLAIPNIVNRMGMVTGGKHLSAAALKILNPANIHRLGEMFAFASELDPSLTLFREGIDDYNSKALATVIPKKRLFSNKGYNFIKNGQERAIQLGFSGILGGIDTMMKMVTVIAAYNQFLAGDAPNQDLVSFYKMSDELKHEEAKAYASSVVESTTMRAGQFDKAVLQNLPVGRIVTRFWNEMRGNLNARIQDVRTIKNNATRMVDRAKSGDFLGASLAFEDSSARASRMILMSMLSGVIIAVARGKNPFPRDEEEKEEDSDEELTIDQQLARIPEWAAYKLTTLDGLSDIGSEVFGSNIPVVRDMMYSADSGRGLSFPLVKAAQDIGTTAFAVTPLMYHSLMDEMTLAEAANQLTHQELRGIFNTVGYFTGGLPISAVQKLDRTIEESEGSVDFSIINQNFINELDSFINRNSTPEEELSDKEYVARLLEQQKGKKDTMDQAIDQMKEIRNFLDPLPEGDPLHPQAYEIIKHAESNGIWNNSPDTSSAFGIYQFTKETWEGNPKKGIVGIMNTPEGRAAGLTAMGRLSKKPQQQETAMRILTKYNVARMRRDKVPINIESVYFAHHFGAAHAENVYKKPDESRLPKSLLTSTVLTANPKLKNAKTVGDMKKYIRDALRRGERSLQASRS